MAQDKNKDKTIKLYLSLLIVILAFVAIMRYSLIHLNKLKVDYYPPNLSLAKVFTDNMLLQRNQTITIWGKAHHDKEIKIKFKDKSYTGKSDENDNWKINIGEHDAGGPYEIKIKSDKEEIILENVLIGDQWLVLGESIINFPLSKTKDFTKEIKAATSLNNIRYYDADLSSETTGFKELNQEALWQIVAPQNVTDIPAVPYYLAKLFSKRYHVPVGIINVSENYIPIKTLLSPETLVQFPEFQDSLVVTNVPDDIKSSVEAIVTHEEKHGKQEVAAENLDADDETHDELAATDIPVEHHYKSLFNTNLNLNGSTLIQLAVDKITEGDISLFINEELIGSIDEAETLRVFNVPASLLKPKYNKIELLITDVDDVVKLAREQLNLRINLSSGTKSETVLKPGYKWSYRKTPDLTTPGLIYYERIEPLLGLKFQGLMIYSGDSDLDDPYNYQKFLAAFIKELKQNFVKTRILFFGLRNIPDYNPYVANVPALKAAQTEILNPEAGIRLIDISDLEFSTAAEEMATRAAFR